jgi:hypothetical protein
VSNGSFGFTFDASVSDLSHALTEFGQKQIPFATVLAIKFTLEDAQQELRAQLPKRFTIRNTFLEKGIRIKFANKKNLAGRVFTVDEILQRQITGGKKGGQGRPVPLPRAIKGSGQGSSHAPAVKVFRAGKRPRALKAKKKVFEAPIRGGNRGIFKRVGKARYPIEFLWRLHWKSTKIDSSFDFEDIATRVFRKRWTKNFGKALGRALASSR